MWMAISPLTAPLKLIRTSYARLSLNVKYTNSVVAIIPNLPFFFCAWRSWSHFKGVYLITTAETGGY